MAHPQQRRVRLIDPRFQFRMVAAFLGVQLLVSSLFAWALRAFFASELQANLASAHATVQGLSNLLLPIVVVLSIGSFLVSTILITLFVVRLSHRLAGPMFRFRIVLDSLGHRVLPSHTAIRPDDQFQEVAAALALTVDTLREDLAAWKASAQAAHSDLQQGNNQAAAQQLQNLEVRLNSWDSQA